MTNQQKQTILLNAGLIALVIGLSYVLLAYVIKIILPFILGVTIAAIFQPIIKCLSQKIKLPKKLVALIIVLGFYVIIGLSITWFGYEVFVFLGNFFTNLPTLYEANILPLVESMLSAVGNVVASLDPMLQQTFNEFASGVIDSTGTLIFSFSGIVLGFISTSATRVPSVLINTLIMIIVSFFMAVDYDRVLAFTKRQLNEKTTSMIIAIRDSFGATLKRYLKSYLIIMTITFIELSIGLTIIGIPQAIIIAFLIAIFDILPIFGTGGILIPWTAITFINGNIAQGFGLGFVYLFVTVVRNFIEPKILGDQIGIHPLVTLFSMYLGTVLFGFVGLFGLPMIVAVLKGLHDSGKISLFR